jgi:hypothetical protein
MDAISKFASISQALVTQFPDERVTREFIASEIFSALVKPDVEFELWDCCFFATGTVLARNEAGWPR